MKTNYQIAKHVLLSAVVLLLFNSFNVHAVVMECRAYTIITKRWSSSLGMNFYYYTEGQHCFYDETGGGGGGTRGGGEDSGGGGNNRNTNKPPLEKTCAGNPILVSSGKKYQHTIDHQVSNKLLTLDRFYHQTNEHFGLLGNKWRFGFEHQLNVTLNDDNSYHSAAIISANSDTKTFYYSKQTNAWYLSNGKLANFGFSADNKRWVYQSQANTSYNFNEDGQILSVLNKHKVGLFYTYSSDNTLTAINSSAGDALNLTYNNLGLIQSVNFNEKTFTYDYNDESLLQQVTLADGNFYNFEYSDKRHFGALTAKLINNKPYATWAYNTDGKAILSEHAHGAERTELTYHDNGATTVKNELGKETTYHFATINGKRLPTKIEGHEQGACYAANKSYTYDSNGYQDQVTDWQGNITDFDYNNRGLITKQTKAANSPQAQSTTITWHPILPLPLTKTTDRLITEFEYDNNHRVIQKRITSKQTGERRIITYSHQLHDNGMVKQTQIDGVREGNDDITTKTFDERGNLLSVTNPLGHSINFGHYDNFGNPGYQVDVNGIKTLFKYDEMGRLSKSTELSAGRKVFKFEYNALGQVIKKTAPDGGTTLYTYDSAYRKTSETNALGHSALFKLDAAGNTLTTHIQQDTSPWQFTHCTVNAECQSEINIQEQLYDSTIHKTYDGLSRVTKVSRGGDTLGDYEYDANNNITQTTDGDGKITRFEYDNLNRKTAVIDHNGEKTQYTYNKQDKITSITDTRGNITTFNYDDFGQLTKKVSGDSGETLYTYNTSGENTSKTNADGTTLYFSYDVLGRITQTATQNRIINSYRYDNCKNGIGRLCTLKDTSSKTKYVYHKTGQLDKKVVNIDGIKYKTDYKFDRLGRIHSVTYPSGQKLFYTYNKLGNIIAIKTADSTLIDNIQYKPFGPIKSLEFGNGQQRVIQYDNQQRIKRILASGIQDISYQYDLAGNIISLENKRYNKHYHFTYNGLNRLTAIGGSQSVSYEYDSLGNRQSSESTVKSQRYQIASDSNRLISMASGKNYRRFKYDANGNIIRDKSKNKDKRFKYNPENRMKAAIINGRKTVYEYNAHGKRVSKTLANGTTFHYLYDATGQLIAESKNGRIIKEYVYLNGTLVGLFVKNKLHYVHSDHLGRPEIVSDSHQNTVWRAQNKAFDRKVLINNIGNLNIGFPGQYWDKEKQSWYNGFRDYDSTIGRYLQSDPIGTNGGINTYNYVLSNPISLVDVLGLIPVGGGVHGIPGWDEEEDEKGANKSPCSTILTPQQLASWGITLAFSADNIIIKNGKGQIINTIPKVFGNILSTSVGLLDAGAAKGVLNLLVHSNIREYYLETGKYARYTKFKNMLAETPPNYLGIILGMAEDGNKFKNIGGFL